MFTFFKTNCYISNKTLSHSIIFVDQSWITYSLNNYLTAIGSILNSGGLTSQFGVSQFKRNTAILVLYPLILTSVNIAVSIVSWWRHQMEIFSALLAICPRWHKGQWRRALMFSLIGNRINSWVNNDEAGDLGRNRAHYDVTVMCWKYHRRTHYHLCVCVCQSICCHLFSFIWSHYVESMKYEMSMNILVLTTNTLKMPSFCVTHRWHQMFPWLCYIQYGMHQTFYALFYPTYTTPKLQLRWRHNGCDGVSNDQPHHCLVNSLFGRRSKKTSKFRVTGLCVGNSPGTAEFPAQMASNAENVSISWRHHGREISQFEQYRLTRKMYLKIITSGYSNIQDTDTI